MPGSYPPKWLHPIFSRITIPNILQKKKEARMRFVQPINFWLDAYPDYLFYEIIPVIWDCWAHVRDITSQFFERYFVRTAIFTSSPTAELFREKYPEMNILTITEGIDIDTYREGNRLVDRSIDLLEFGRDNHVFISPMNGINHLKNKPGELLFQSNNDFVVALSNAKIAIAMPKLVTDPNYARGIETLTQRYWECMLSRTILLGHAPKELTDFVGYNPVVEIDMKHAEEQVKSILANVEDYQPLVDKNRETALKYGDWKLRIKQIMRWLQECGYEV